MNDTPPPIELPPGRQNSFELKDWVSFGFSAVALVASVASLWLSNFYTDYDSSMGVVGGSQFIISSVSKDESRLLTVITVVNNGSRPVMIIEASYRPNFITVNFSGGDLDIGTLPIVVPPHDVTYFRVDSSLGYTQDELDIHNNEQAVSLVFSMIILDSSGARRRAEIVCRPHPGQRYVYFCDNAMVVFKRQ